MKTANWSSAKSSNCSRYPPSAKAVLLSRLPERDLGLKGMPRGCTPVTVLHESQPHNRIAPQDDDTIFDHEFDRDSDDSDDSYVGFGPFFTKSHVRLGRA